MGYYGANLKNLLNKELAYICRLLAQGFTYPNGENCSDSFFSAVEQVARALDISCKKVSFPLSELREAYTLLFINEPNGQWAPPFSSVYLGTQGMLMDTGRDEAIKFYKKAGLEPVKTEEPEDFLATELHFLAELVDSGQRELLSSFLSAHLLKWYPHFYARLKALEPHPYYLLLAEITSKFLNTLNQEVIDETT